ncbi:13618_t:CDS:1 [Dentiscutata heterogama]|uniref:13618_t:CDS:1 n=1 Tax=Dentiscutata heterogama TaxID=1316150 RepID=A0ACA9PFQ8_9GLOM|nr:13618_t:CDS:1 [Dentiscutata heterogama]
MPNTPSTRWSLIDDFSTIHNPNSVWSYGFKPAGFQVSGDFSLFTHLDLDPKSSGIVAWFAADNSWQLNHYLGIYFNPNQKIIVLSGFDNSTTNNFGDGFASFNPYGVALHPGDDGRFAVVRFIAPLDGNYTLKVSFSHVINNYSTSSSSETGGYIIHNNRIMLWETDIIGVGNTKTFTSPGYGIHIKENDTIDFIVGIGQDNSIEFEMTMTNVEINLLPEIKNSTTTRMNQTNTNHNVLMIAISLGAVLGFVICTIVAYFGYLYFKKRKRILYDNSSDFTFADGYF